MLIILPSAFATDMNPENVFITKSWFQTNKFIGTKIRFKDFMTEIENSIKGNEATAHNGIEYLFGDWPVDPQDERCAYVPAKFSILPVPEPLEYSYFAPGTEPTPKAYRKRRADAKEIVELNAPVIRMKAQIFKAFVERLSPELGKIFGQFSCEPYCGYVWLNKKFGALSGGIAETCTAVDMLIDTKMAFEERFTTFFALQQQRVDYFKCGGGVALSLLLSDRNTNTGKRQTLPDRLMEAARHCRREGKTLDESVAYITAQDNEFHDHQDPLGVGLKLKKTSDPVKIGRLGTIHGGGGE